MISTGNQFVPLFLRGERKARLAEMAQAGALGFIIPIGGAENRVRKRNILRSFVELCGGTDARIAIIPTASALADTGRRYEKVFRNLGANRVSILDLQTRRDCESPKFLDQLDNASGVFLTGGDQLHLSRTLHGTPIAEKLRQRHSQGMHVAGTSAGAAVMSKNMIAGGKSGSTPRADLVELEPGLGVTNQLVIDQHFRQRDRLGRLLTALAYHPEAIGIGLDENTAVFIGPDLRMDIVGTGGITIVDPSAMRHSIADPIHLHDPVSMLDLRIHILVEGDFYDLPIRTPSSQNVTREKLA